MLVFVRRTQSAQIMAEGHTGPKGRQIHGCMFNEQHQSLH